MSWTEIDDEEIQEATDRAYWEKRGSKETMGMTDKLLQIAQGFNPGLELNYTKFYIGLAKEGVVTNSLVFRPKKNSMRFEVRLKRSPELEERLEQAGLDLMDYDKRWGYYRIRLQSKDIETHLEILTELIQEVL